MSEIEKHIQAYDPPVLISFTGSSSSGTTWADIGTSFPKLATPYSVQPSSTLGMVLQRPLVCELRGSSLRPDPGTSIAPLVIGLVMMFVMRRDRC